ncbi:hypothetical protein CHUAL_001751 [Chamberlinius hualienensis]
MAANAVGCFGLKATIATIVIQTESTCLIIFGSAQEVAKVMRAVRRNNPVVLFGLEVTHVCGSLPGLCDAMVPIDGTQVLRYLRLVTGLSEDEFHFDENGDGPTLSNVLLGEIFMCRNKNRMATIFNAGKRTTRKPKLYQSTLTDGYLCYFGRLAIAITAVWLFSFLTRNIPEASNESNTLALLITWLFESSLCACRSA